MLSQRLEAEREFADLRGDEYRCPRDAEVKVDLLERRLSVHLKLADLVEPIATPDDTLAAVREIQALSLEAAADRFLS